MNYMEIERASVSNGTGFRVVLYVAGCTIHCPRCHNPETWDFDAGKKITDATKEKLFEAIGKKWVTGVTFTGGHPLEKLNIKEITALIFEIRNRFPSKSIWLYTGYDLTIDDFVSDNPLQNTICNCDVVVDGKYINEQRDITLPFIGSANQRVINVKETLAQKKIIEMEID